MSTYKIAVMIGSLRRESYNKQLAGALAKLGPSDFSFEVLKIDDIPLYNQDDDANQPAPVKRLKAAIKGAQGIMVVTPEYNRSIPGVLKNAIDAASRPYGDSAFTGKPAGVVGISIGAIGTAIAQQHLRNVLAYLHCPTLGQPEVFLTAKDGFFDAQGGIADGGTRKFIQGWMDAYVAWVKHHTPASQTA